jgi:pimeloyl-ACP methyl ester carboxylesterase
MSQDSMHPTDSGPIRLADHDWFYVGGRYVERGEKTFMVGQMYVERYVPEEQTRETPVVMIHGGGQTGTNFTGTPDGRRGWLHDFLRAGYTVYVVDQPERARSGHLPNEDGKFPLVHYDVQRTEQRFTAPENHRLWPQAERHTRWPGAGVKGDPIFEKFFASQVEALADRTDTETFNRDAGVALLAEIGPAVLIVHSQSGPFGWLIGDARPDLVKAILSVEPNGPPFYEVTLKGGDDWYEYDAELSRPYGITRIPLTFEPPVSDPAELGPVPDPEHDDDDLVRAYLQSEPARQLPNLQTIPIMMLVTDASYHASYDHGTSRFLTQAGVAHDYVSLPEKGIEGNGHMVMCESNNHEVADLMIAWLEEKL